MTEVIENTKGGDGPRVKLPISTPTLGFADRNATQDFSRRALTYLRYRFAGDAESRRQRFESEQGWIRRAFSISLGVRAPETLKKTIEPQVSESSADSFECYVFSHQPVQQQRTTRARWRRAKLLSS